MNNQKVFNLLLLYVVIMKNIGSIVIYKLKGLEQIERDRFCRELLGRTVKTHGGKYTHHVVGLLDTTPHIRIGKGIIIVEKAERRRIADFLRSYDIKDVFIRDIILTESDIQELKR